MNPRRLILIAVFTAGCLLGLVLWVISPPLFFALLNLLGIVFLMLGALSMIVTLRKAKAVKPLTLGISPGIGLLAAIVVSVLMPTHPGAVVGISAFAFGGMIGIGWAMTGDLFYENGRVCSRGNAWYLLVWALMLALNQGLSLLTGRTPSAGFLLAWCGAGLLVGQSLMTFQRYRSLTSSPTLT